MAVSESQWKEPGGPVAPVSAPAAGWPTVTAAQPALPGAPGRGPWPGAMGPPVVGPPPRLSARPPTPAAAYGAWQGAVRPPVFKVSNPRPTFREPLPVRAPMIAAGAGAGAAWMLLLGLLAAGSARGYVWVTLIAGLLAWGAAALLARFGDRGVAVGVAAASGIAVAIAGILVAYRLAGGVWLLW
ncbi:hypothetical protein [Dactylosporangium sp. CA-092794]|uniref:hypothetical protein n=1 Tax=Dactylosporangium sp. CA-092794 TaxID=3239929 RepID=UPI003D8B1565